MPTYIDGMEYRIIIDKICSNIIHIYHIILLIFYFIIAFTIFYLVILINFIYQYLVNILYMPISYTLFILYLFRNNTAIVQSIS